METSSTFTVSSRAESIIQQAFAWMFGGLLVTAVTAFAASADLNFQRTLATNPLLCFGLCGGELALVVVIRAGFNRLSHAMATGAFILFAALNGVMLSSLLLIYSSASIEGAFLGTSLVFGAMALYGYATKTDLSKMGSLAIMTLFGAIIMSVINFFLHSGPVSMLISYVILLVFVALTAYDTQKLKEISTQFSGNNLGIFGALALYLDFINIFLALLRLFGGGNRRD